MEVKISKDGSITPTNNKIEVSSSKTIKTTTLQEWLKKFVEIEPAHQKIETVRKYNKRRK